MHRIPGNTVKFVDVPATAAAPGYPGQIAYATGFLYICITVDTWEKCVIATW